MSVAELRDLIAITDGLLSHSQCLAQATRKLIELCDQVSGEMQIEGVRELKDSKQRLVDLLEFGGFERDQWAARLAEIKAANGLTTSS